jgi:hypothetical protein
MKSNGLCIEDRAVNSPRYLGAKNSNSSAFKCNFIYEITIFHIFVLDFPSHPFFKILAGFSYEKYRNSHSVKRKSATIKGRVIHE